MDIKIKHRIIGVVVIIALGAIIVPFFFNRAGSGSANTKTTLSAQVSNPSHALETREISIPPNQATASPKRTPGDLGAEALNPNGINANTRNTANIAPASPPPSAAIQSNVAAETTTPAIEKTTVASSAIPSQSPSPQVVQNNKPDNENEAAEIATTPAVSSDVTANAPPKKRKIAESSRHTVIAKKEEKKHIHPHTAVAKKPIKMNHTVAAWTIQLGSFSAKENAEKLVKKLRAKGYPAYIHKDKSLHKVFVGPEIKREKADQLAKRLDDSFNVKGLVVKYKI